MFFVKQDSDVKLNSNTVSGMPLSTTGDIGMEVGLLISLVTTMRFVFNHFYPRTSFLPSKRLRVCTTSLTNMDGAPFGRRNWKI